VARPIAKIELTAEERIELRNRVRAATTPQRDSLRAKIILGRAQGEREKDIASRLGISIASVSKWSSRVERLGLDGLKDAAGRGRRAWLPQEKVEQVLIRVTQPPKGRRRWSVRTMAKAVGMSHESVRRIWKANDLKPHLTRTFKLSRDPQFESKFWDVIGLGCGSFPIEAKAQSFNQIDGVLSVPTCSNSGDIDTPAGYLVHPRQV
jgi:transposase